jgi:hypothetical protein
LASAQRLPELRRVDLGGLQPLSQAIGLLHKPRMLLFGLIMSHLDFVTEMHHLCVGPLPPLASGFRLLKRLTRPFVLPFDLRAQPV